MASSRIQSIAPSPEASPSSQESLHTPSLALLPPFEGLSILARQTPIEANESGSGSEHDVDAAGPRHPLDDLGSSDVPESEDDGVRNLDGEEEEMDDFHDTGGTQPKAKEDVRGWEELREQIKADLEMAHRQNVALTQINQLLILWNFATLRMKGFGRITTSQQIAAQWHDGVGTHFACQIWFLAHHYQLFCYERKFFFSSHTSGTCFLMTRS
jgi:hypothetical protein